MSYLDRDEAIKRLRAGLKRKTGKTWSVRGGRGTAWGWIDIQAPPARRICHDPNPAWKVWDMESDEPAFFERQPREGETGYYTSIAECKQLQRAFKLDRWVSEQGISISPDEYRFYVGRIES